MLGHEFHVRQEITPRRVLAVSGLAAAGTVVAIEAYSHGIRLPSRLERHMQLPNRQERPLQSQPLLDAQIAKDPTQFAGA